MKSEQDIIDRMEELKEKLLILDEKKDLELKKFYKERDNQLLIFIYEESCKYNHSLLQLQWLFSE
jgi:hypothetical protein